MCIWGKICTAGWEGAEESPDGMVIWPLEGKRKQTRASVGLGKPQNTVSTSQAYALVKEPSIPQEQTHQSIR